MLLPSDMHRKRIMSITAVLLPFVNYLLTLPCIMWTLAEPTVQSEIGGWTWWFAVIT
jgi:hypothetical protein